MIFFCSDTHFLHANIIKYCNRPFADVNEMNAVMMRNWNRTVSKDDVVIHAGDFMFGNKRHCETILNRLNGQKILIHGNHDPKEVRNASGWNDVMASMEFEYDGFTFKVKHFPWKSTETIDNYNGDGRIIHCHGHTHNSTVQLHNNSINLSVEHWNYTPVSIDTVIKLWVNHHVPF